MTAGPASRDRRTAILVSGMHRSGTSAMTRMVSLLGATLPDDLIEGRVGDNEPGFWESRWVVDENEHLLARADSWWGGWQRVSEKWLAGRQALRDRIRDRLAAEFGGEQTVVLKDPRVSRLLPLWVPLLEEQGFRCVHVIAVREPAAVVNSIARRNELPAKVSLLSWLAHTLDAERATRGQPRVFVSYERLLADWRHEADRISAALDLPWPAIDSAAAEIDAFMRPDLDHAHQGEGATKPGPERKLAPIYDVIQRWAEDDVRDGDQAVLERWASCFDDVRGRRSPTATIVRGRDGIAARREGRGKAVDALTDARAWRPVLHDGYVEEANQTWDRLFRELRHARAAAAAERRLAQAEERIAALEARARGPRSWLSRARR